MTKFGPSANYGFISPMLIGVIAIGVLTVTNLVTWNLYRAKSNEHEAFKVSVKAVGDAQEAKTKAENERLKREKDNADKALTDARADVKRLRGANSRSRNLSGSAASTGVPGTTCYDRTELDRAYGVLVGELRAIVDQGAACSVELDNARSWALQLVPK